MGYKQLYEEWKKKQISFGFVHPSEHSKNEFNQWIEDQIDSMWSW